MYFRKQYRMEEKFEEGNSVFILSETTKIGLWTLENSSPGKLSLNIIAEVASKVLCGEYPYLKEEEIKELNVSMKIGNEKKAFTFEKGYSKQRILHEMTAEIWVS